MANFIKLNKNDLYKKTFTVFGDSISDVRVSAYPDNRPDFWCEQLVRLFNMTMYNEAISGSTTGFCKNQIDLYPYFIEYSTTSVINTLKAIEEVKNSDIVFIFSGTNDSYYKSKIGEIGDVDDNNYQSVESLKGAYSYLIDKIRQINPNVKIICMNMTFSTWSKQDEYHQAINEVIKYKNCNFIDLFDLWNESNVKEFCPDGIHPQTSGYNKIINALIEKIEC